jgi:dienelactone hydrolase
MTDAEQRARTFLETLARHDWPAAEARFDPKMAELLPLEKLESFWVGVESNAGSWVGIDAVAVEKRGAFDVAKVRCNFVKLHRLAQVSFDKDVRVAGLLVGPDFEAPTREFIDALARNDFVAASRDFDETMRTALPPEKLADAWNVIRAQAGDFVSIERIRVEHQRGHWIAFARCSFSRREAVAKVVYDAKSQIAGLFFLDAAADTGWSPPPYANPDSFVERAVQVGDKPVLPGFLSMPKSAGPFPAVVLVHGSGPQDADETVGGVRIFKDLAFGLATRGVAVLRYAKRTRVEPRGVVTIKEEYLEGARAAVDVLSVAPGVDAARIVVLGHSQGGYLAPWIAREDGRVSGLVIMAGNTRPLQELIVEQARYAASLYPSARFAHQAVEEAELFKRTVEDPSLTRDQAMPPLGGASIASMTGAYFLDLRGYHPEQTAAHVGLPMLVAWGKRDFQVREADYLGWKNALGGLPQMTFREYASLNHLFVAGTGPPTPAEYEMPSHVDSEFIEDVATWIRGLRPHLN